MLGISLNIPCSSRPCVDCLLALGHNIRPTGVLHINELSRLLVSEAAAPPKGRLCRPPRSLDVLLHHRAVVILECRSEDLVTPTHRSRVPLQHVLVIGVSETTDDLA